MATTLSLVIIFLPIAFMTGYARKYVNSFGWTMAMAILVSLLVAFTLTPMMSSRFLKLSERAKESALPGFLHAVELLYLRMLNWSLAHRRAIILICVVTFLSTFGFYPPRGTRLIPADDQSELISSFTLPEGTRLLKTTEIAQGICGARRGISGSCFPCKPSRMGRRITRICSSGWCREATQAKSHADGHGDSRDSRRRS